MKDIKGYEGEYAVTSCGKIWSYKSNKFLKLKDQRQGYKLVILTHDGVQRTLQVHRLVANTYLSNPNNYPCINHKNGIKEDNRVQNLEWCTYSQNMQHAYATGLMNVEGKIMKGHNCKKVKCIETGIVYESGAAAARAMGLDPSHISKVCQGKAKSHKGFHFEFVIDEVNE